MKQKYNKDHLGPVFDYWNVLRSVQNFCDSSYSARSKNMCLCADLLDIRSSDVEKPSLAQRALDVLKGYIYLPEKGVSIFPFNATMTLVYQNYLNLFSNS